MVHVNVLIIVKRNINLILYNYLIIESNQTKLYLYFLERSFLTITINIELNGVHQHIIFYNLKILKYLYRYI